VPCNKWVVVVTSLQLRCHSPHHPRPHRPHRLHLRNRLDP